jgi:type III secretion protein J
MRHGPWIRWWVVLGLLLALSGCGRETLLRDLTERDANEIVAVLYASSMEVTKVADPKGKTFSVDVLSSDLARAVAVLRALGLPKSPRANLNEVFRATGFAPTPFEERVRYLWGQAQELERTISLMEGVLQTRVHVVTPDGANKRSDLQQSKASVYVSYDDRYDIEILVPRIRKMVSDSVEGLIPTQVEILAIPSRVDLKVVTEVPIRRVLGVRVHKSDANLLLIEVSVVLGLLVMSVGLHVSLLLRRRARERAVPATGAAADALAPGGAAQQPALRVR